jgi:hypothetical protein
MQREENIAAQQEREAAAQQTQAGETPAIQDSELTVTELVNQVKRDIQLQGGRDPENFKMPGGRSLADQRRSILAEEQRIGAEADKTNAAKVRELGRQTAPKARGAKVGVNRTGQILSATPPSADAAAAQQQETEGEEQAAQNTQVDENATT